MTSQRRLAAGPKQVSRDVYDRLPKPCPVRPALVS